jgi:hypothetical protein
VDSVSPPLLAKEVVVGTEVDEKKQEDIFVLLVHQQDVVLYVALAIVLKFARQLMIVVFGL